MQEDIENKSLTLIINTSKLTARTLASAFMKFLRYSRNKIHEHQNVKPQGKQSVKQLIAQNQGVENTELADRNEAKSFDRYARQYGVDYAIQKGFSQDGKPRYSDDDNPLALKSDFILSLCELIVGGRDGLQPIEKTIIDRAVHIIYQPYLSDPRPENIPILEDL